jgi:O-antigen/teichoic acid export membrane protein
MTVDAPRRTKTRERLIVVKNAIANIARGSAASIVAVFLPPFLTRSMSSEAFGAWALVLQLGAYVGYFDFGIQTAIGRFVAHSTERHDLDQRNRIVSSAFVMLSVLALLAALTIAVLVALLPDLFHQIHSQLIFQTRITLLLVGGSLAFGLPGSVFSSTFIGLQRNEVPAAIIGLSRLLSAALVVLAVRLGGDLISMGTATAAVNVASAVLLYVMMRKLVPSVTISLSKLSWSSVREIFDYCTSLSVWSIGMLLVTGLDLTVVGIYRFNEVAYYAVAATLVTFLNGLFGAVYGALGSPAAVLHARNDREGLGDMVARSTRVSMLALLAIGIPMIIAAGPLLHAWVGPKYALHAAPLLQILVAANMIRICVSPYIIAMIGTGEQRKIILVPIIEGVVNLGASVLLARSLGAAGVAWGTLIGSFISLGGHLVYTIHRSQTIDLKPLHYLYSSLLRPIACGIPALLCAVAWRNLRDFPELWLRVTLIGIAGVTTVLLLWKMGLTSSERRRLCSLVRSRTFG